MTAGARGPGRPGALWLAIGGAVLAGLTAGLAPKPGGLAAADGSSTSIFAALASSAIVALSILPFIVRRNIRGRTTWIAASVVALILGVLSYAGGGFTQRACLAQYGGKPVVVGTELTPLGAAYSRTNPELSRDELLFDSAGVADRVWTRQSIDRCRVSIAGT